MWGSLFFRRLAVAVSSFEIAKDYRCDLDDFLFELGLWRVGFDVVPEFVHFLFEDGIELVTTPLVAPVL